jgi:hypothetical protein
LIVSHIKCFLELMHEFLVKRWKLKTTNKNFCFLLQMSDMTDCDIFIWLLFEKTFKILPSKQSWKESDLKSPLLSYLLVLFLLYPATLDNMLLCNEIEKLFYKKNYYLLHQNKQFGNETWEIKPPNYYKMIRICKLTTFWRQVIFLIDTLINYQWSFL